MQGIEAAKTVMLNHLVTLLPAKLAEITARLSLDPADPDQVLEAPRYAVTGEPDPHLVSIEEYPALFVAGRDTLSARQVDPLVYRMTYRLRIWLFVTGQEYAPTDARRDRLTLAVRELLLARPRMSAAGLESASIIPSTLRESYSDVSETGTGRNLAGVWLEVNAVADERLPGSSFGTVQTAEIAAVPAHPALD